MAKKQKTEGRTPFAAAALKNARIAPQKARLVAKQISGMNVRNALATLETTRRHANPLIEKVLKSAIANAMEKDGKIDTDELIITSCEVNKARTLKRFRPRAMGRATTILKHSSHINLSVG